MNGCGDGEAARATLRGFRDAVYASLGGWTDALFELADALLETEAPVGSVPSLSLEPVFRRGHGSLYKALARGRVDADRLRGALAAVRPPEWPAVFAVDASTWPRCDAETSPERGFYYSASRHSAGQPIVAGAARRRAPQPGRQSHAGDPRPGPLARRAPGARRRGAAVRVRRRL